MILIPTHSADPPTPSPTGSSWRRVAVAVTPAVCAAALVVLLAPVRAWTGLILAAGVAGAAASTVTYLVRPLKAAVLRARRRADELEVELVAERAAHDVQDRLDRALMFCDNEADVTRTALRAVAELLPDHRVALLLQVPGQARIAWELQMADGLMEEATPVPETPVCTALASGTTVSTPRSTALDACAHLRNQPDDVSAMCVPLLAEDRTVGVVSLHGAPGDVPDAASRRRVEWVATRAGARIAELRRAHAPVASRDDALTGLPTAPAMRVHLRGLIRSLSPFCVAVLEVDHHEELPTDDAADAAILALADAALDVLRPDDFVGRLEGPRLAVVLDRCSPSGAAGALERVREHLVLASTDDRSHGQVTFSAGVVSSSGATSIDELLANAESVCDAASSAGGNRVSVAG
jgi:GGDEF domain-containing protein